MRLPLLRETLLLAAVLVAGLAGSAGQAPAASTPTTVAAVADAYVSAAVPRANYGRATSLVVARRPASIAYLRFSVGVPAGATVSRATLRLFALPSAGRGSTAFTVYRVAGAPWGERTITYGNAPPVGTRVMTSPLSQGGWASADVTAAVSQGGLVSLALEGAGGAPLHFRSREAGRTGPRLVVETAPRSGGAGTTGPTAQGPCGTRAGAPGRVEHVIWIWMENKPYDTVIGSPSAPYENQLADACGLATSYHGVAHPSLPNYIAATSGDTQGITDDDPPTSHPLGMPSIFSQVKDSGRSWREYAESAPAPCSLASSGTYAVRHDPAAYYTTIRGDCSVWDVPMGTTAGGSFLSDLTGNSLPAFSLVTPDLCDDTHDCSVATGDAWLQSWFAKILASPAYLAGGTVVFVVWDENDGSGTNQVPLLVVSPSTVPGTRSGAAFDHYALLKTAEQLLGLPFLGHAGDPGTSSMVSAFGLG